ncbi:site-specific DNA-methyltransferase [Ihubacter massiliensis]|uniref:DNA-methyltransferase n=1 Tax=Ihubacter massiliensis TaxID=1852367 RepID=UPI002097568E|nr:site-specific DNA-methyltransferase [Ihubacter massiliensis]MCO7121927.1 site-specific DNA-methyltransferase [Ihubacter massiliensis]
MLELNKIYNIDCLEGIKKIDDNSINAIITDPPYCIGTTSNGKKGDWQDNNLIRPFFRELFSECKGVLRDTAALYINTDWRTYPFLYPILQEYFNIRNLIVWDYEWIKAGSHYRYSHEFIIYATMPDCKRSFSASERDVWRIRPINYTSKNKLHNAQKPVELHEKAILNSTKEGDTVLDCFTGSGTTAVACKQTGRNFIGFELQKKYCEIASERIAEI